MNEAREHSALRSGLLLALFAGIAAALVAGTWALTGERIAANERAARIATFVPVLAGIEHQRVAVEAPLPIEPPHELPGRETAYVYPVIDGGRTVALVFEVSADGYGGPIRLLVAVRTDGVLGGVRVLRHSETPGLGDDIETGRSDWIKQFAGLSIGRPPAEDWALEQAGGAFDQFTGASITPRAVVRAVKRTLLYFEANRERLLAYRPPSP